MADFGFLSDTDDSAVEVISQAQDLCVLEQLSAINCSSFTDSVLPSDLDSRFRRLKSLPAPVTRTAHHVPEKDYLSDSKPNGSPHRNDPTFSSSSYPVSVPDSFPQNSLISPSVPKAKSRSFASSFPLDSSPPNGIPHRNDPTFSSSSSPVSVPDSFPQNSLFSPSVPKAKSRSFASPYPLDSSPPRKFGCFWCSPKKKQSRKNRALNTALGSDEFLSDMATISFKEQQKMLDKVIKEQDKVLREAEKVVKLAKQASARMIFHGMKDELSCSDDEPAK